MKLIREYINEKFTDDSDPIHDMGIGLPTLLKRDLKITGNMNSSQASTYYWETPAYDDAAYTIFRIIDRIVPTNDYSLENIQKMYYDEIKYKRYAKSADQQKRIIETFKKFYGVTIQPIDIKESLNEKFTDESDPIKDLDIGMITWDNIKPGDIVKQIEHSDNGVYLGYGVIFDIQSLNPVVEFAGIFFGGYTGPQLSIAHRLCKSQEKKNRSNSYGYQASYQVIPRSEIEEYFKIIQPREFLKHNITLNEKFTGDSDPIQDMGIGVFYEHNFKNTEELAKFVVNILPRILKKDKIPDDIILLPKYDQGAFKWEYFFSIQLYCRKYLKINGNKIELDFDIVKKMRNRLLKMGYPKIILKRNP
jgi:hypothetical protein